MRVALHDADQTRFPNLALMKLSAWHKSQGDSVEWFMPLLANQYDKIYSSKVFTFTPCDPYLPDDERVVKGGTGYRFIVGDSGLDVVHINEDIPAALPDKVEHMMPDYSFYQIEDTAYGFTTRGCPNKCGWCIVPHKEGKARENAEIGEFWNGQKSIVLMDNNIIAHEHGIRQLEQAAKIPAKLDCNQGLDARLVDRAMAKVLASVRWEKIRFACDQKSQMDAVGNAVQLVREQTGNKGSFFVYVLVKDIEDALERVEFLRELGVDPFAQPYRNFKTNAEPTKEQKRFARWVNHKAIFKSVKWEDYR